jgi:putative ubiquitin-RnfH superfamily antitoxin RatB of RatAB toxin-antitoxin module
MGPVDHPGRSPSIQIQLAWSPGSQQVLLEDLTLPTGATLGDALKASQLVRARAPGPFESLACGIWSKLRPLDHPLRDGDRVEVYRNLLVDPKEARRQRYRKTRSKRSGPSSTSV